MVGEALPLYRGEKFDNMRLTMPRVLPASPAIPPRTAGAPLTFPWKISDHPSARPPAGVPAIPGLRVVRLVCSSSSCRPLPLNVLGCRGISATGVRINPAADLIASELPRAAAAVPPLSRLVGYSPADAELCDGSPVRSARPANRRVAGRAQRPPRSATTAPTEGCPPPSPLSRDWG